MTAATITGTDFVILWTKDYQAAVEFYGTVLGLPCIDVYTAVPGAEFETGNLTLAVMDCAALGREFQPSPPIALRVDDVAAARAALEARGVTFQEAFDTGVCEQAVFQDPDGNTLLLHHRYAPKEYRS